MIPARMQAQPATRATPCREQEARQAAWAEAEEWAETEERWRRAVRGPRRVQNPRAGRSRRGERSPRAARPPRAAPFPRAAQSPPAPRRETAVPRAATRPTEGRAAARVAAAKPWRAPRPRRPHPAPGARARWARLSARHPGQDCSCSSVFWLAGDRRTAGDQGALRAMLLPSRSVNQRLPSAPITLKPQIRVEHAGVRRLLLEVVVPQIPERFGGARAAQRRVAVEP